MAALVSDTNRFNADTGVPAVERLGGAPAADSAAPLRRRLRLALPVLAVEWEEEPFEWVRPQRFGDALSVLPEPALARMEIWNDFLVPNRYDIGRGIGTAVALPEGKIAAFGVHRPRAVACERGEDDQEAHEHAAGAPQRPAGSPLERRVRPLRAPREPDQIKKHPTEPGKRSRPTPRRRDVRHLRPDRGSDLLRDPDRQPLSRLQVAVGEGHRCVRARDGLHKGNCVGDMSGLRRGPPGTPAGEKRQSR